MDFETYTAAIQALAERDLATPQGELYCEPEIWRASFDDGLTPEEAWSEECAAAATMLG